MVIWEGRLNGPLIRISIIPKPSVGPRTSPTILITTRTCIDLQRFNSPITTMLQPIPLKISAGLISILRGGSLLTFFLRDYDR